MNNSDAIAAFVGGISVSATSPTVSPRLCFDAVDSTYDHPGQSTDLQKQQKPHILNQSRSIRAVRAQRMLTTSMASWRKAPTTTGIRLNAAAIMPMVASTRPAITGLKHHALGAACNGDGARHGGDIVIHNDHLSAFGSGGGRAIGHGHADIGNSEHRGIIHTVTNHHRDGFAGSCSGLDCGYLILREQFGVNLGQCRLRWQ